VDVHLQGGGRQVAAEKTERNSRVSQAAYRDRQPPAGNHQVLQQRQLFAVLSTQLQLYRAIGRSMHAPCTCQLCCTLTVRQPAHAPSCCCCFPPCRLAPGPVLLPAGRLQ
jgi:hypothetical protein